MKIYQKWKRNEPDTVTGESITVTITYCSFDKGEIDELQKKMPNGMSQVFQLVHTKSFFMHVLLAQHYQKISVLVPTMMKWAVINLDSVQVIMLIQQPVHMLHLV